MIVDCDMRKWGDRPHWRFPASLLGEDEFGTWLGATPPTPYTGPRGEGTWTHNFVLCVPSDRWWIATFNAYTNDLGAEVYVDMTTVPVWLSESHVQAIDLDLDVIRLWDGTVMVDDEDEFAEHQLKYGYPPDVVARARESCEHRVARVEARAEPFGEVGTAWLNR
jgi:protein associated with RNAse G/E